MVKSLAKHASNQAIEDPPRKGNPGFKTSFFGKPSQTHGIK